MRNERTTLGQSTVEYAVVLFAFLSMLVALGVVWRATQGGRLADYAIDSASHSLGNGLSIEFLQDITAY